MTLLLLKLILLLAALATLPACSNLPAPVVTEVKIPVSVPCDAPLPDEPAYAVDALPIDAPIDAQMRALRAERQQRKGYARELTAAAKACR